MRIAIDLDGVVYDFTTAMRAWVSEQTGRPMAELPTPETWYFFREQWSMTGNEFHRHLDAGVEAGFIFRQGEAIEGAVEALGQLRTAGHSIHLVTNRKLSGRCAENTEGWLREHKVPYDSLTFTTDKTMVDTDVYVDDRPENVKALLDAGKRAVLFDQPWNRDAVLSRVKHWAEFVELVEFLELVEEKKRVPPEPIIWVPSEAGKVAARADAGEVRVVNAETGGEKGSKLARFDLVPPRPLWLLASHYGIGSKKYDDRNWEKGLAWSLNFAAMMRHAWQFWGGEELDDETGSPHLAAVAWHAFALLEYSVTHPELDDRPKPSTTTPEAHSAGS